MYSLLLAIIYIAFISLGLPDSLIGAAWPVMYRELNVPISYAGIITMIIAGGTIISSLMSDRMTRKIGVGFLTSISVLMTAIALFGFSISNSFYMLCLFAIPYGIGAGGVDAALNNYVALYYKSRHMSWLHCFWGVGAMVSPYIMSYYLINGLAYNNGYRFVSFIQIGLVAILFISLPLWRKRKSISENNDANSKHLTLKESINIKGVKLILITFFAYCALESTTGLWASSYLVEHHNISEETSAKYASLFFFGITLGRFICGFISEIVGDKKLIRYGILICISGVICLGLPINNSILPLIGLIIIGFGCAPIYPSIIHATPTNFGRANSQAIIGLQMACAYTGSTFMPPLFGLIIGKLNISLYPLFLLCFAILMLLMSEKLNKMFLKKEQTKI